MSEGDASLQTMPIIDDVWSLSRQPYRFAARGSSRRFPPSMRESVSGARGEILATTALFTSLGKERSIRPSMQDSRCEHRCDESTNNAIGQRVIPLSIQLRRGRFDLFVHTSYKQGIRRRLALLSILIRQRESRSVVSTPTKMQ